MFILAVIDVFYLSSNSSEVITSGDEGKGREETLPTAYESNVVVYRDSATAAD